MQRAVTALLLPILPVVIACVPRHGGLGPESQPLTPAPPPPPGSIQVWGPLRAEEVTLVRTEVGWERELVRGERLAAWDVVVVQQRATCPANAPIAKETDAEGCRGTSASFPATCQIEPQMRARFVVTARWGVDFAHRCAGDASAWNVPGSGDARASLTFASSACFRTRNRFKPEASWTSLYALTELTVRESLVGVDTPYARVLARLLTAPPADAAKAVAPSFCRDDGAYLDGSPGVAASIARVDPQTSRDLVAALVSHGRTDLDPGSVPLTDVWRSEHDLWEACHASSLASPAPLIARERCQLLRQLDRFVRDVEDLARPETPKGSFAPSASATGSTTGAPPGTPGAKP